MPDTDPETFLAAALWPCAGWATCPSLRSLSSSNDSAYVPGAVRSGTLCEAPVCMVDLQGRNESILRVEAHTMNPPDSQTWSQGQAGRWEDVGWREHLWRRYLHEDRCLLSRCSVYFLPQEGSTTALTCAQRPQEPLEDAPGGWSWVLPAKPCLKAASPPQPKYLQ